MCSYFFQYQPALIDDVSGKGRREWAAGTGECTINLKLCTVHMVPDITYLRGSEVFPQFSRAGFRESPRRHLQRDCTPSTYYPRGFRGRLFNGFVNFGLRWFQMMLGKSFGFWSVKRHSLLKPIFNLNLTFEMKNRLRQTKLKGFPKNLRMHRQASGDG